MGSLHIELSLSKKVPIYILSINLKEYERVWQLYFCLLTISESEI